MSAMPNLTLDEIEIRNGNRRPEPPMLRPTIGPPMADIRGLHREAGCYAYDPALGETGICRSAMARMGFSCIAAIRSPTSSRLAVI
jgi:hypothetical protein